MKRTLGAIAVGAALSLGLVVAPPATQAAEAARISTKAVAYVKSVGKSTTSKGGTWCKKAHRRDTAVKYFKTFQGRPFNGNMLMRCSKVGNSWAWKYVKRVS